MPGTNLTREEAQQRAAVVTTQTYVVELDLIRRFDRGLRLDHDDPVRRDARCLDVRRPGRRRDHRRSRSTASQLDPAAYADSRIPLADLAADNELRVEATCAYSHSGEGLHRFVDPVDDRVYLYTQFEVPGRPPRVHDVRAARPQGHASSSTSPRPPTGRSSPTRPRPSREPVREGVVGVALRADRADVDVHHGARRRRVPRGARRLPRRRTARSRSASSAGSRWSSTSTPTTSSPSPSRASRSSRAPSRWPTRSASTTSCSCRSTTWARWRTPAA